MKKIKRYNWYLIQVSQGSKADLALQQQLVTQQEIDKDLFAYWRMASSSRDHAIGQLLLGLSVASFIRETEKNG